jgi:hypothetical protein
MKCSHGIRPEATAEARNVFRRPRQAWTATCISLRLFDEEDAMCDYSLHAVRTRLAREGEHLIVHRFSTGTRGLVAQAEVTPPVVSEDPQRWWQAVAHWLGEHTRPEPCAVCIPPGATLLLRDVPLRTQRSLNISANEEVTFTQVSADWDGHRDAIRLGNGAEFLLQKLPVGQQVQIVTLTLAEDLERVPFGSEVRHQPQPVGFAGSRRS